MVIVTSITRRCALGAIVSISGIFPVRMFDIVVGLCMLSPDDAPGLLISEAMGYSWEILELGFTTGVLVLEKDGAFVDAVWVVSRDDVLLLPAVLISFLNGCSGLLTLLGLETVQITKFRMKSWEVIVIYIFSN